MNEEANQIVEYLREDACTSCIFNSFFGECTNLSSCMNKKAADLIESLSAQLEQTENKLSELLYYVTGGRFSKADYSIDDMRRFVDDYNQSECNECDQLEYVNNERDRLNFMLEQAQAMLETRTKERDAAVADLKEELRNKSVISLCENCRCKPEGDYIPNDCMDCVNGCNWQWRGV